MAFIIGPKTIYRIDSGNSQLNQHLEYFRYKDFYVIWYVKPHLEWFQHAVMSLIDNSDRQNHEIMWLLQELTDNNKIDCYVIHIDYYDHLVARADNGDETFHRNYFAKHQMTHVTDKQRQLREVREDALFRYEAAFGIDKVQSAYMANWQKHLDSLPSVDDRPPTQCATDNMTHIIDSEVDRGLIKGELSLIQLEIPEREVKTLAAGELPIGFKPFSSRGY